MMAMKSDGELERSVATRFTQAKAARTRPPVMQMGLKRRRRLESFMMPFVDKAFEQATLSQMLHAAAGRGAEDGDAQALAATAALHVTRD